MRKIILTSLFFCLAITTVLAQITPDGTTTSTSDVSGVTVIGIAAPDSNGLSNNTYSDFDISSSGVILNNSASASASQLTGGNINGNSNITAGSEAILILNQVTSNNDSLLEGTTEVVGTRAGVIIANPNGITCSGCGFINANRVDLITGTANFSGDDLTGFSIDDAARFFVSGNGFVSDAVADELNLVSRDLRIQTQAKANTTLRVLAGNDTYNHTTNIITSDATEASANSIQINASGYLEANYIELISTEISSSHGILNAGGGIEADRLRLDSNGLFRNQNDGTNVGSINISGLLEVITADRFINNGNITADSLTITTDAFSNNDNGGTQLGKIVVTDIFSLYTPNTSYTNTGTVASAILNLITSGDFVYNSATLNSFTFNNLAITTAADYTQGAAIDIAGDLSIQVSGEASLDDNASIKARNLFFSADDLYNQADITVTENAIFDLERDFKNGFDFDGTDYDGGNIIAGSFNVTATGDFVNNSSATISADTVTIEVINFSEDIKNTGTVSSDNLNFILTDDFVTTSVSFNGFKFSNLGVSTDAGFGIYHNLDVDNLTIKTAFNFANQATITADNFTAIVGSYFRNHSRINAENFTATVEVDFRILSGVINADNFNVTLGGTLGNYSGSMINADNVTIEVLNFDDNIDNGDNGATVSSDSLNFILTDDFTHSSTTLNGFNNFSNLGISTDGSFTNSSTIDIAGNLAITAGANFSNSVTIDADTVTIEVTNFDNDISNTGTVSSDSLNFILTDDFTHSSTTLNGFNNFSNLGVSTDGNFTNEADLTLNNLNVTAGDFENYAAIYAENFNVTAVDIFNNRSYATITADILNATVNHFFNETNAIISADECNIIYTISYNQGTITCDYLAEIEVIDIARPDANGLSNNYYSTFYIPSNGVVLNNSDSAGTSQLVGDIPANSNYSTGDVATLILAQVTDNDISLLLGTLEVFGAEAGVIIANPNGITCDGCGFINTNRVDLITGTSNFSGDDLTGFSIDDTAIFFVRNNGFISDALADELNLVSRDLRIQAQAKANATLRVLAGNDTYNHTTNITTSDATEASAHSIQISASGSLEASYIELISTEISSGGTRGIVNYGRDISADRLRLDANGLFRNQNGGGVVGNINIFGLLEVINAERFINNGNITADTLTITADAFFNNHNGTTQLGKIFVTDTFFLSTPSASYTNTGTVTSDSLNLTIGGDFTYESTTLENFAFNNLAVTTDSFTNDSTIDIAGNLTITVNSFVNTSSINTDSFALSVAGAFDYVADFLNNNINTNRLNLNVGGNFSNNDSTNNFTWGAQNNLTVLGNADITTDNYTQYGAIDVVGVWTIIANADFTHSNTNNDFIWDTNDSLSVTGNADITTDNYTQNGAIDVAGALAISAMGDFTNFTAGSISADTLAITVGEGTIDNDGTITTTTSLTIDTDAIHNSGSITANTFLTINATNDVFSGGSIETSALAIDAGRNFGISGSITSDSLNITAGYTALNTGTIVSGSLDITTDDFFRNLAGGKISVDSLNITAGGKVTNIATITAGTLNIIANNDSTRDNDTTGFYVANRGDITVTNLINITAVDNFYNTGDITADTLAITAKDILLLNTDSIEPYDGGDIVLSGDSSFTADGGDGIDGGIIVNRGNIDLGSNNLDITADSFINHVGANVTADTLNLDVSSFVQNGFIDATIDQ